MTFWNHHHKKSLLSKNLSMREVAYFSLINSYFFVTSPPKHLSRFASIFQAEVHHLPHMLMILGLLEVVIQTVSFKFGANNFNLIKDTLGSTIKPFNLGRHHFTSFY